MRHTWTGKVRRCPAGNCPHITNLSDGFTDWALVNCKWHGNILIIHPDLMPFVEFLNQETAFFYCYECGETEAWGVVPEKYKATTPCQCQRKEK